MLKKMLLATVCTLFLFGAGTAQAYISDFAVRPGIDVGDTVTAIDFTPDGRFLAILHGLPGTVSFLDTWDMMLLGDTTGDIAVATGPDQALSLSVSPYNALPYAYVGLKSGKVVVIDCTPLTALGAAEELATPLTTSSFTMAASPIEQLMAMPEMDGKTNGIYLWGGVPSIPRLYYSRLAGGKTPAAIRQSELARIPVALARGADYGYVVSRDPGGQHYFNIISCSDLSASCPASLLLGLDTGSIFSGLAADRFKDVYSVTLNRTTQKQLLVNNLGSINPVVVDAMTVPAAALSVAMAPTPRDPGFDDVIFTAGGETISVAGLTGLTFGGSYLEASAGTTLTTIVTSGSTNDGYAFAGGPGGLVPVTANPWVESLSTTQTGNTIFLNFRASSEASGGLTYKFYKNVSFRAWPRSIGGATFTGDTVTSATLPVSELDECINEITLVVQDAYLRQGRAVTTAKRDTNPPAPSFSLGYGHRRVIVNFTASDLCDLNHYKVFWGDTNTLPEGDYTVLNGGSIEVDNPIAGDQIQKVISGLTDGKRYYVQLVAFDDTDHAGVSSRLSVVPQAVLSISDATDEDGGFDCLGSLGGGGGDPRALFGLLLPLMIYAMARLSRREKR